MHLLMLAIEHGGTLEQAPIDYSLLVAKCPAGLFFGGDYCYHRETVCGHGFDWPLGPNIIVTDAVASHMLGDVIAGMNCTCFVSYLASSENRFHRI